MAASKKDRVPRYVPQEPETAGPSRNDLLSRYGLSEEPKEGETEQGGETEQQRKVRVWEEQQAKKLQDDSRAGESPSDGKASSAEAPRSDSLEAVSPSDASTAVEAESGESSTEATVTHLPANADEHGYVAMPQFSMPTSEDRKERLQHYLRGIGALEYATKSNEQRVQQQRLLVLGEYISAMKGERAWEAGGYTTLGDLLLERFGIRKDYANKVERALPVVRALESITTMDLKERQLRILVPVQRDHGDDAVRKVWEEATRRGKLTEKSLEAAVKFLGLGAPEVAEARVTERRAQKAVAATSDSTGGDGVEARTSDGGGGLEGGGPPPVTLVLQRIRELRSTDEEQARVMMKELISAVEELRAEMGIDASS
ncbi:hypothetical protein [Streptomyces sp. CAU 1734]|uniref:hypothetical protein n=1 Tax=Streptomyces sp. CAU 1734 TaxID=3140360 RepID=UPI0032602BF5